MTAPPTSAPRLAALALLLALVAGAEGCAFALRNDAPEPLDSAALPEPEVAFLQRALQRTIEKAHADPETTWHSGGWGNVWVNLWGSWTRGLCHEWQEYVYVEILPAARRVGWDATGVGINVGVRHEHHAVVVFDPEKVARQDLLVRADSAPAYVLDAWRRGKADVYHLRDWIILPEKITKPAKLEDLDAILGLDQ